MSKILLIGMGGFIGAVFRYLISGWVQAWTRSTAFPYGTLAVNLLGCLLIGFLSQWFGERNLVSPEVQVFIFIGVLGAFTTFSTFGNETLLLLRNGARMLSLINVGAHIFLGLAAVWLGHLCGQWMWR